MLSLGIDSGTQSTKAVAVDVESGAILATAQRAYGFIEGLPPVHLEQDPRTWVEAMDGAVRECLAQLGKRRDELVAIGVSGQQHGLVVLDKENRVIRPAKLWCDTSTTGQCEQFAKEFGGAKGLVALAGNPILPGYTAPKILWLQQNEPGNYAAANCFLLPHDYLNYHLTGEKRMEFGDASGTGLMDVRTRQWCKPLFDFIDPELIQFIPKPESSRKPVGLLRETLRKEWGLSKAPVVSAGGGDNMMGALGTGNIAPGVLTASLGTSGTLYAYASEPVIDPECEVAAFCDGTDAWLPLVCTMNVTVATERVREMFGWDHLRLEAAVRGASPGADGLLFLPYLNGERTPNLPHATGVLHGLTTHNMTPANFARAAMEGVTLGLAYGLRRLRELGLAPAGIRLTGGGSKSPVWRQLCADVFGAPTVCIRSSEGAALGAALQAQWVHENISGHQTPLSSVAEKFIALDEDTRCEPVKSQTDFYGGLLARQTDLTRKLYAAGLRSG